MKVSVDIKGQKQLKRKMEQITRRFARTGTVKVGFFPNSTYPPRKGSSEPLYVAQVAAWQEYGTHDANGKQHIPPRPFMRTMARTYSPRWGALLASALQVTELDSEKALGIVAEKLKDQMVETIVKFDTPPNADATIEKKGFDDPLIDSGHMMRSVEAKVEMKQ